MKNKINVYFCSLKHSTITIDRVEGTTPMIIDCPICEHHAYSQFYQVDQDLTPTHEFYKPETVKGLKPWFREHVKLGGLLLRKIQA